MKRRGFVGLVAAVLGGLAFVKIAPAKLYAFIDSDGNRVLTDGPKPKWLYQHEDGSFRDGWHWNSQRGVWELSRPDLKTPLRAVQRCCRCRSENVHPVNSEEPSRIPHWLGCFECGADGPDYVRNDIVAPGQSTYLWDYRGKVPGVYSCCGGVLHLPWCDKKGIA